MRTLLKDKVAIVTGGASGIGKSLCEELCRQGAAVIVADIDAQGAETVAQAISRNGGNAAAARLDVTNREAVEGLIKDTTEELEKRHELEHNLIQTSMDGIIANDRQGNIIIFNEGAERIYGYTREEAISSLHVSQLYPAGVARKIKKMIYGPECGGAGRLINYAIDILAKSGGSVPILLSATLLYEEGREVATVGYFKDMREVKRLEQELIKRYDFEHNLVQTSMDGIIANDRQGNIIIFNEGAERIYGYSAEEALSGMSVTRLYPEGEARRIKKLTYGDEYGGPGRLVRQVVF